MNPKLWTIDEIQKATDGELAAGTRDARFSGISIDSRQISADEMFVAVRGATHDGHVFVPEVIQKGISGIIVEGSKFNSLIGDQLPADGSCACVLVDDSVRALGDLAAYHRRRFGIPVVCVTGSNGKTTTKEMTAAVLGEKFNTLKTYGNLNNEFGVPLTLFRLDQSHEAAVVELGMNHPGEIHRLSQICRPDIGIITNIAAAHLEGLGSVRKVMAAKGELIENIAPGGFIILNNDNEYCRHLKENSSREVVSYGFSKDADIFATQIECREKTTVFNLNLPASSGEGQVSITINAAGRFMVSNALAASAVGFLKGISAGQIKSGIEKFRPVKGRMDIKKSRHGFFIIDDSYNANPGSMEAAITTLVSLKGSKKGVLVAGDMLELGDQAEALHEGIGAFAARSGVDRLFLTGKYAPCLREGAQQAGMATENIVIGDKAGLVESLVDFLEPDDWMVVKGSRGSGMEAIVDQLEVDDASAA